VENFIEIPPLSIRR